MLKVIIKSKNKQRKPVKVGQVRSNEYGRAVLIIRHKELEKIHEGKPVYKTCYKALILKPGDINDSLSPFETEPINYDSLTEVEVFYPFSLDSEMYIYE